jgi:hypothetical protein
VHELDNPHLTIVIGQVLGLHVADEYVLDKERLTSTPLLLIWWHTLLVTIM